MNNALHWHGIMVLYHQNCDWSAYGFGVNDASCLSSLDPRSTLRPPNAMYVCF